MAARGARGAEDDYERGAEAPVESVAGHRAQDSEGRGRGESLRTSKGLVFCAAKLWHLPIREAAPQPFHRTVVKSRQPPVAEDNLRRVDHEHEQHLLRTRHAPMAHGIAVEDGRTDQ